MAFIEIRNYGFAYPSKEEKALDGISLEIEAGEFILLCGESGSGKSTLLRSLKPELSPFGTRQGAIFYCGGDITALDERASASQIGFVMQNPDAQPVTDKVWHELAFGLENLGFEPPVIRRRVAEMASFFGIQGWFRSDVDSLSGGQKQILNLACVMAMQPKLLILDEPTSQLDPVASREFLETVVRLNRELS
ncbi:MAG: ABC transporter ATP-binding protein, partial [Clostridia bacterium]|nr:ABC transporter ATP-binding protein [Clostridia bacterium]